MGYVDTRPVSCRPGRPAGLEAMSLDQDGRWDERERDETFLQFSRPCRRLGGLPSPFWSSGLGAMSCNEVQTFFASLGWSFRTSHETQMTSDQTPSKSHCTTLRVRRAGRPGPVGQNETAWNISRLQVLQRLPEPTLTRSASEETLAEGDPRLRIGLVLFGVLTESRWLRAWSRRESLKFAARVVSSQR
jgi:hypothetical protein